MVDEVDDIPTVDGDTQQYKVVTAEITADRFAEDVVLDIAGIIGEINFFEDIDKPYISGSVVIVDDSAILDTINFRGTEKLLLEIVGVAGTTDINLSRKFSITGIEKTIRTNDRTEVTIINLLDETGYNTHAKRISKSFTGKVEDIIAGICISELGVEVDRSYCGPSIQPPMKIIVPYLNPLEACMWMKHRATRADGSPYFVYASIHDPRVRIGDYATMMSQEPFNAELPYHYSAAGVNAAEDQEVVGNREAMRAFTISGVQKDNMENTLEMIKRGSIGSSYSNTDISGGMTHRAQHKIENTIEQLQVSDVIKTYQEQNVFDAHAKIDLGPKGIVAPSDFEARSFHKVSSSRTYVRARAASDDATDTEVSNRAKAACIHTMVNRNSIMIQVPGTGFMLSKVSVGDMIRLTFLKGSQKEGEELMDPNRSGDYLILATRHLFKDTSHDVSLSVAKIARGSQDNG